MEVQIVNDNLERHFCWDARFSRETAIQFIAHMTWVGGETYDAYVSARACVVRPTVSQFSVTQNDESAALL